MNTSALIGGALVWLALTAAAAAEPIRLARPDGSELSLEQPAQRLVTLSPHLTELAYAAGAGPLLLATVAYSEYPPEAAMLPRVGDAFRIDVEAIVALSPDLVIAWDSGNPQAAITQLQALGVPVWSVEIREPREIIDTLQAIGTATGRAETAGAIAGQLDERLRNIEDRYRGARRLEYFYQVDARPLFTISDRHLISKGLALCGGRNIFEGEPGLAFQVAHEAVVVANPAAMFAPHLDNLPDPLADWRSWPGLRAVKSGALFLLPADAISRATPRWFDSLESACTLLHDLRLKTEKKWPPHS